MDTELIHGDPECQYKHFVAKVGEPINPDSGIDIECFMSTDSVDADDEVMLPDGIDLARFTKNPVVMLCHAMGQPGCYYPLPVGRADWTRRVKRGVLAGVKFSEKSAMGREVKALFEENMLRSFSVGFRPLEASPMTRKEAESRPDWAEAFERTKGHVRVHRKWHMVELSVAPIPSNPDALVTTYKAKGIVIPAWLHLKSPEAPMTDEEPMEDEETEEKACECGKADCEKCEEQRLRTKDDDEDDDLDDDDDDDEAATKAMDGDETEAAEAEEEMEDEGETEEEEAEPIKRGDHVKCMAPHYKGYGKVMAVHSNGLVSHTDNDMMASPEEPAARVKCYKKMQDGHVPTDYHVAVKCMHMSKMDTPMVPPTKGKAATATTTKVADPSPEPLPPLVALSEAEVQQEAIRQAAVAATKRINELFGVV